MNSPKQQTPAKHLPNLNVLALNSKTRPTFTKRKNYITHSTIIKPSNGTNMPTTNKITTQTKNKATANPPPPIIPYPNLQTSR